MLKRSFLPAAFLLLAPVLSGCLQEEGMPFLYAGREVSFVASSMSPGDPFASRTEYSGKDEDDAPVGRGSRYERIDWVKGTDRIRIACPQAAGVQVADYSVTGWGTSGSDKARSKAEVAPVDLDAGGLKWGSGEHLFFAMYPAPGTAWNHDRSRIVSEEDASLQLQEGGASARISGVVPAVQHVVKVGNAYKPDMNHAYMYAREQASAGEEVHLPFHPLVTVFEFRLHATDEEVAARSLTGVLLRSSSTPMAGRFSADVGQAGNPEVTVSGTGSIVSVTMPDGAKLSSAPITVTLLALPVPQTDLTLELSFDDPVLGPIKRMLPLSDPAGPLRVDACKKVIIDNLQVEDPLYVDSMEMEIATNATVGRTFRVPFPYRSQPLPADIVIDWGDGTEPDFYPKGYQCTSDSFVHAYAASTDGDHTVTITSTHKSSKAAIPALDFDWSWASGKDATKFLRRLPAPLLKMDRDFTGIYGELFGDCVNLKEICSDLFQNNPQIQRMDGVFEGCTSLETIPEGLFDHTPLVTSFAKAFEGCTSLSGPIPAGLFDQTPRVTSFERMFYNCPKLTGPIPEGLFDNNPQVTTFYNMFARCSSLTGPVPEGLFDHNPSAKNFCCLFWNCPNLSGGIPEGLFDNNPLAENFAGAFYGCRSLTGSIPEGLFDNNPLANDFNGLFNGCSGLTGSIPAHLFDNNPLATNFANTFSGCSGLTGGIPVGLFDFNPEVKSFAGTFNYCSALTGSIPAGFFDNQTKVVSFEKTFNYCSSLTGEIPAGLFDTNPQVTSFAETFMYCRNLTGGLPPHLFDNNPQVTSFYRTFEYCSGISGEIPEGFFDNNPQVTNFQFTFGNCPLLTRIPPHLFDNNPRVTSFYYVFGYCTSVSEIPPGLFDNNPEVKDFGCAFRSTSISSIPGGLFDHNPQVTSFGSTFADCSSVTEIPPGLFDNNTRAQQFGRTFEGTGISSIPAHLFDYNTAATSFSYTFESCGSLVTIPEGLFAFNLAAYNFFGTFYDCPKAVLPANIFIGDGSVHTSQTRFASLTEKAYFGNFYAINSGRLPADGGTAPDLWNYRYGKGYNFGYVSQAPAGNHPPFRNHSNLSNWDDIPATWK